ncbi:iron-sulfur cluster repair di-iron protein [Cellulophaga tyrosinoxydans]|uniref:Regulator of cell morphogenesis and NO signaling n=1 Tax=Cellulophaga tyrosinoxydans TaxID=504486 RepID=A0A1W2A1N2_9FLAO|nr:iron-sulfur cluster repair di-iron protein [Cellulophaga tyrosinoxydans]SMC54208.1 regulator of cell morphogenesis and NO signaling [Cellulophaga tyrosinoxydans]
MEQIIDKNIGAIVAQDYRTAAIFEKFGLDFCCNGRRSIEKACQEKQIDPLEVYNALDNLQTKTIDDTDYKTWSLDVLANYIENTHHKYVEDKIPVLLQYLEKINNVHGNKHPELDEVYNLFRACAGELTMHMKKEELILFPYIKKMVASKKHKGILNAPAFVTVQNPIQNMMHEHDNEGERFRQIELLTNGYTPSEDACATYTVSFALLKEFQEDLHKHIHLENNILFPKAEKLETELLFHID